MGQQGRAILQPMTIPAIRIATPADAAAFARLNALFNEVTLSETLAARHLTTCAERVLLAACEDMCRAASVNNIMICTGHHNHAAQRLYRGMGFVDDDIRLRKSLVGENPAPS